MKCPFCNQENTRVIDSGRFRIITLSEEDASAMNVEKGLLPMKRLRPFL